MTQDLEPIQYFKKNVYGNEMTYLKDSVLSLLWFNISGKKTIDMADMSNLSRMFGASFIQVMN